MHMERWKRVQLTRFTSTAFVVTTKSAIEAAKHLFQEHNFQYVLPAVFSTNPLEKFFGQVRQRNGDNFYIDIMDVIAAAKAQRLHQLIKNDILPSSSGTEEICSFCSVELYEEDVELIEGFQLKSTQELLVYVYAF